MWNIIWIIMYKNRQRSLSIYLLEGKENFWAPSTLKERSRFPFSFLCASPPVDLILSYSKSFFLRTRSFRALLDHLVDLLLDLVFDFTGSTARRRFPIAVIILVAVIAASLAVTAGLPTSCHLYGFLLAWFIQKISILKGDWTWIRTHPWSDTADQSKTVTGSKVTSWTLAFWSAAWNLQSISKMWQSRWTSEWSSIAISIAVQPCWTTRTTARSTTLPKLLQLFA